MSRKTIRPQRELSRRELEAVAAGLNDQLGEVQERFENIIAEAEAALDLIAPEADEAEEDWLADARAALYELVTDPPEEGDLHAMVDEILDDLEPPESDAADVDNMTGMIIRTLETFAAIKLAGAPFQFDYQELARAIASQLVGKGDGPVIDV